jgi:hypothetical protein
METLLARYLRSTGFDMLTANTGMAGLNMPRRHNGLVSGAEHFLPKPLHRGAVCNCVEKALRTRDAQSEADAAAPAGAWR